jgi:hypothetical protein
MMRPVRCKLPEVVLEAYVDLHAYEGQARAPVQSAGQHVGFVTVLMSAYTQGWQTLA